MDNDGNQQIRAAVRAALLIALSAQNSAGIVSEIPRAPPPVVTVSKRQDVDHALVVADGPEWREPALPPQPFVELPPAGMTVEQMSPIYASHWDTALQASIEQTNRPNAALLAAPSR